MKYALGNMLNGAGGLSRLDPDAKAYIAAVQAADGQSLETGVRNAINNFVLGLKANAIWDNISSACILAGARTLSGALVPLRGSSPTNFNFVSADYNRKTGLVGNATTKHIDTGTANANQNNQHMAVYVNSAATANGTYIGIGDAGGNTNSIIRGNTNISYRSQGGGNALTGGLNSATGFLGMSRSSNTLTSARDSNTAYSNTQTSGSLTIGNIYVFAQNNTSLDPDGPASRLNARIQFYTIGTNIGATGLSNYDSRLQTLMSEISAAIP